VFQKFNTDTLVGRFIKCLLSKEVQPLLDCVQKGDIIIKDCIYIFDHFIIKCYKTGKLYIDDNVDELFPSDTLYPSAVLYPGTGEEPAQFKVIDHYDESIADRNNLYTYNSNVHWYDSETHKQLGNYLRYIKNRTSIDLMPYYNCFSAKELDDVHLYQVSKDVLYPSNLLFPEHTLYPQDDTKDFDYTYIFGNLPTHTVYAIPIKFDKIYTIALDCDTPFQMRCLIYGKSGMVKRSGKSSYYSDYLEGTFQEKSFARFDKPFLFSVQIGDHKDDLTIDKELYQQQSNLYLVMQVPKNLTSSIVVLEGNYAVRNKIATDVNCVVDYKSALSALSLLRSNTKESYAFSDRLIEYLLWNVVSPRDRLTGNIARMQETIGALDLGYASFRSHNQISKGVWDDEIQRATLRLLNSASHEFFMEDQDGYGNKDVERIFEYLKSRRVVNR